MQTYTVYGIVRYVNVKALEFQITFQHPGNIGHGDSHERSAILSKPNSRLSILPISFSKAKRHSRTALRGIELLLARAYCSRSSRTCIRPASNCVMSDRRKMIKELAVKEFEIVKVPFRQYSGANTFVLEAKNRG